ncbi:hypothetical protein Agabi119p4_3400 [Agaricus bisporus var. burnettii]|uniref:Uncharacterized protein n=1 Tax=Agaricus bisporus var. burnettii TaxID=192524 RepID=A0A8H7F7E2_AGABI|nr:hypothetical protein Agabi119p4_3400 [Agaricus bisporus var. burnettii]
MSRNQSFHASRLVLDDTVIRFIFSGGDGGNIFNVGCNLPQPQYRAIVGRIRGPSLVHVVTEIAHKLSFPFLIQPWLFYTYDTIHMPL